MERQFVCLSCRRTVWKDLDDDFPKDDERCSHQWEAICLGNCNVCGRPLYGRDEDEMGLCGGCANDWKPDSREMEGF